MPRKKLFLRVKSLDMGMVWLKMRFDTKIDQPPGSNMAIIVHVIKYYIVPPKDGKVIDH